MSAQPIFPNMTDSKGPEPTGVPVTNGIGCLRIDTGGLPVPLPDFYVRRDQDFVPAYPTGTYTTVDEYQCVGTNGMVAVTHEPEDFRIYPSPTHREANEQYRRQQSVIHSGDGKEKTLPILPGNQAGGEYRLRDYFLLGVTEETARLLFISPLTHHCGGEVPYESKVPPHILPFMGRGQYLYGSNPLMDIELGARHRDFELIKLFIQDPLSTDLDERINCADRDPMTRSLATMFLSYWMCLNQRVYVRRNSAEVNTPRYLFRVSHKEFTKISQPLKDWRDAENGKMQSSRIEEHFRVHHGAFASQASPTQAGEEEYYYDNVLQTQRDLERFEPIDFKRFEHRAVEYLHQILNTPQSPTKYLFCDYLSANFYAVFLVMADMADTLHPDCPATRLEETYELRKRYAHYVVIKMIGQYLEMKPSFMRSLRYSICPMFEEEVARRRLESRYEAESRMIFNLYEEYKLYNMCQSNTRGSVWVTAPVVNRNTSVFTGDPGYQKIKHSRDPRVERISRGGGGGRELGKTPAVRKPYVKTEKYRLVTEKPRGRRNAIVDAILSSVAEEPIEMMREKAMKNERFFVPDSHYFVSRENLMGPVIYTSGRSTECDRRVGLISDLAKCTPKNTRNRFIAQSNNHLHITQTEIQNSVYAYGAVTKIEQDPFEDTGLYIRALESLEAYRRREDACRRIKSLGQTERVNGHVGRVPLNSLSIDPVLFRPPEEQYDLHERDGTYSMRKASSVTYYGRFGILCPPRPLEYIIAREQVISDSYCLNLPASIRIDIHAQEEAQIIVYLTKLMQQHPRLDEHLVPGMLYLGLLLEGVPQTVVISTLLAACFYLPEDEKLEDDRHQTPFAEADTTFFYQDPDGLTKHLHFGFNHFPTDPVEFCFRYGTSMATMMESLQMYVCHVLQKGDYPTTRDHLLLSYHQLRKQGRARNYTDAVTPHPQISADYMCFVAFIMDAAHPCHVANTRTLDTYIPDELERNVSLDLVQASREEEFDSLFHPPPREDPLQDIVDSFFSTHASTDDFFSNLAM